MISVSYMIRCIGKDQIPTLASQSSIYEALTPYCGPSSYIAINIAYDLQNEPTGNYPDQQAFTSQLVQDPTYKREVITHPNILHVALRQYDFNFAAWLCANGYEYVPWLMIPLLS